MERRMLLRVLALAGLAAPAMAAQEPKAKRIVYHIADADKVAFALGNMRNHHAGAPDVELCAVVHGSALAVFRAKAENEALKRDFADRLKAGDVFYACANTLAAHQWTLADILPGFGLADKGGVVKLADLQAEGWIYLRP